MSGKIRCRLFERNGNALLYRSNAQSSRNDRDRTAAWRGIGRGNVVSKLCGGQRPKRSKGVAQTDSPFLCVAKVSILTKLLLDGSSSSSVSHSRRCYAPYEIANSLGL